MPDITMCCNNDACKIKDTCYRNTAIPEKWRQSYAYFYLDFGEDGKCKMYENNKGRNNTRKGDE